jgi:hypothetical protein
VRGRRTETLAEFHEEAGDADVLAPLEAVLGLLVAAKLPPLCLVGVVLPVASLGLLGLDPEQRLGHDARERLLDADRSEHGVDLALHLAVA